MAADPTRRMPKSPASASGRQLMQTWLRQKLDADETACVIPATGTTAKQTSAATVIATDVPKAAVSPGKSANSAKAAKAAKAAKSSKPGKGGSVTPASPSSESTETDSVQRIAADVNACTRCRLHETRDKSVPGVGPDDANLVFVGEGPGAEEDRTGEPFVGRAGQLLTKILAAVKLRRDEVFITNIVKCRPPNNRDPKPDEIEACEPYLKRQLRALDPKVICTLGRHAAMTLLQSKESMGQLRKGERSYEGVRVFPTYHPAALLRNPQWKRPVWEDIQNVRKAYDEPHQKT